MDESFDDLMRQAQQRKSDADVRAQQAADEEADRLARIRARAASLLPEVDKAVATLRRAGSLIGEPDRDPRVNDPRVIERQLPSSGLGEPDCIVRVFPRRQRFNSKGSPSRWGRAIQPSGWRFTHVTYGNGSGICWGGVAVFVPVSGEPFVTPQSFHMPGHRRSIREFAELGRYEWREGGCSYKVDTDDILARTLRAVAAYVAGE